MRALFLDRDGVINRSFINHAGKPQAPRSFKDFIFLPYVKKYLDEIKKNNFFIFVVTNQPDISYGYLKKNELEKMHNKIYSKLSVTQIFTCIHGKNQNCKCRKPKTSMFKMAIKKYKLNIKSSYTIGDRSSDINASLKCNIKSIFIDRNYNEPKPDGQIFTTKSSRKALEYVIKNL